MTGHTLDQHGHCLETCAHTDHATAPLLIALDPTLEGPFRDWIEALGVDLTHVPASPAESAGMRHYTAAVDDAARRRLTDATAPTTGRMRPPHLPRPRRR